MTHRTTGAPRRRTAVAGIVAVLLVLVAGACQPAREARRDRPILLVHGWSASGGTSCSGTFDRTISQLRSEGFTGPFVKVGFYTGDTGCSMSLRSWGSFENGSSWKDVAKAFSRYVHATYTSKGIPVDVIGYSMGGNIARGAVYGSSIRESGFSAPIQVEDAVTLGTPHAGAAWYSTACLWGQCSTLKPGASDIQWLNRDLDPQGPGGTEWTVVGSDGDAVTPLTSALYMALPTARKVSYPGVPHTGSDNYLGRTDIVRAAGRSLAEVGR
ncbi:hypothetical protein PO878_20735 [Iamia majanohamensis]|uniref:AB hydrolase-1 domain-containing protein n=1 Tax=Iamia majanohamensis TaxID=467976 RepID=A0AAF0BVE0_9ACTN|nr:alpha/beta fold hydrolase [Iamia majanohamensis]WCO66923.1 hypothetical protein PO878_20735 [Iamia majanohamensis]